MISDRDYMREEGDFRGSALRPSSVTAILLMANVAAFILKLLLEGARIFPVTHYFSLSVYGLKHYWLWQLVTYQFLHGGFFHLLFNGIAIYFFGRPMEGLLGKAVFLRLYLLGGVAGGLLQMAGASLVPSHFGGEVIGASGSAFALVAAFATCYPNRPLTLLVAFILPVNIRAKYLLLLSVAIAVFGMAIPGDAIAHGAHLGGIIFGVVYMKWAIAWQERTKEWFAGAFRRRAPSRIIPFPGTPGQKPGGVPTSGLDQAEFISQEVDPILEKISAHGIHSLTARERKILEVARARMAKR